MTDKEIEDELQKMFEINYESLKLHGGHSLTPEVREAAWNQVLYYFKKLRNQVAEKVTKTEVKLTLPEQETPEGRHFTIEGVVDIVIENDETWMYDFKTHEAGYIKKNKEMYEQQLNVYAYIWEHLRNNKLDHTAIISTVLPIGLRNALRDRPIIPEKIKAEIDKWEPVIPLDFSHKKINETIKEFGAVVDNIQGRVFKPASPETLDSASDGSVKFVTRYCVNCDGRFSCSSYRKYVTKITGRSQADFKRYYSAYDDETAQTDYILSNLNMDIINREFDKPE
jgi:hypothetical protein